VTSAGEQELEERTMKLDYCVDDECGLSKP
jgi:hypothetical protein